MTENSERADLSRGIGVVLLMLASALAAIALGVAKGWSVGLGVGAASCVTWGALFFWLAIEHEKKDTE